MMRQGGRNKLRTAKIIIGLLCILLLAVLAGGMIMGARGGGEHGAAVLPDRRDTYQQVAKAAGEQLTGAADKVRDEARTAEAARKAREKKKKMERENGSMKETGGKDSGPARPEAVSGAVSWNDGWEYAGFSKIHTGQAVLYKSEAKERQDVVVAVNAGHGTSGGTSVQTQCHPDGSPKVTGGSTAAGSITAAAVSGGTTLADGTSEASATLAVARAFRDDLLAAGFDVLMLRDGDDVQLDNLARTVMANNNADCHISIHYDSSANDKGFFYISVPDAGSYRSMEPVASHWQQHNALGESLLAGVTAAGVKVMSGGSMAIDLTQTSYSTIPSVDVEVGDRASDHSSATIAKLAQGMTSGVKEYFKR